MNKLQFRVLYRQFLFRVFDLEVLSAHAQGDANKLLGQFAALLVFVSVSITFGAMLFSDPKAPWLDPRDSGLLIAMVAQHFLIATTMLVVGLFAVLSWDSTFPDRRDVLVYLPPGYRRFSRKDYPVLYLHDGQNVFGEGGGGGNVARLDHRSTALRDGLVLAAAVRLARRAGRAPRFDFRIDSRPRSGTRLTIRDEPRFEAAVNQRRTGAGDWSWIGDRCLETR